MSRSKTPGALLVAWTEEQRDALNGIAKGPRVTAVTDVGTLGVDALYAAEQSRSRSLGALAIHGEGIICPFTPPIAFATEAVPQRGRVAPSRRVL